VRDSPRVLNSAGKSDYMSIDNIAMTNEDNPFLGMVEKLHADFLMRLTLDLIKGQMSRNKLMVMLGEQLTLAHWKQALEKRMEQLALLAKRRKTLFIKRIMILLQIYLLR
jgi:hypothetical protein